MKTTGLKVILGLLTSILIAYSVNIYLNSLKDSVPVVVAAQNIPAQTRITADLLTIKNVNQADQKVLVPNAFHRIEDLVGTYAIDTFKQGDILLNNSKNLIKSSDKTSNDKNAVKLDTGDARRSYFIPSDKRETTIKVDGEGSLAFNLMKGDKVDVIFTSTSNETNGIYSAIIMQKIEIADVDKMSDTDKKKNDSSLTQNITLLVTPQQAQDLALAKRKGKIDLILTPLSNEDQSNISNELSVPNKFSAQKGVSSR